MYDPLIGLGIGGLLVLCWHAIEACVRLASIRDELRKINTEIEEAKRR